MRGQTGDDVPVWYPNQLPCKLNCIRVRLPAFGLYMQSIVLQRSQSRFSGSDSSFEITSNVGAAQMNEANFRSMYPLVEHTLEQGF